MRRGPRRRAPARDERDGDGDAGDREQDRERPERERPDRECEGDENREDERAAAATAPSTPPDVQAALGESNALAKSRIRTVSPAQPGANEFMSEPAP